MRVKGRKRTGEDLRQNGEEGSALVEFVLCFSLFWLPLFLGMMAIGLNLIRAIQVTEVCRDAAHMSAYGIDFSQPVSRQVLLNVAQGLNITSTGGNGVVILSTITFIAPSDCAGGGLQQDTTSCPNMNQQVITRRITIGNTGIRASVFGTPLTGDMDSSGNVSQSGQLTHTANRANGFSKLMTLASGQNAFVGEMFVSSPDLNWYGQLGSTGSSARSIF